MNSKEQLEKKNNINKITNMEDFDAGYDEFKIEIDTGNGGYGFIDTIPELLADVEREYGNDEVKKVNEWLKTAKENDEYISSDGRMHIYHIGKQIK